MTANTAQHPPSLAPSPWSWAWGGPHSHFHGPARCGPVLFWMAVVPLAFVLGTSFSKAPPHASSRRDINQVATAALGKRVALGGPLPP